MNIAAPVNGKRAHSASASGCLFHMVAAVDGLHGYGRVRYRRRISTAWWKRVPSPGLRAPSGRAT
jgi:hypothetical protein